MCDWSKTVLRESTEEDSEDNSDDNLKIVEYSSPKRKSTQLKPSKTETLIIESIEDELERRLEEKAAKTNLNSNHVKNIIKHVVTNEHVLALVRKAENPKECAELVPYEPKLTRAKAKELLSNGNSVTSAGMVPIPSVSWATPAHSSEVQVLFSEDLQEDSSGDEYIPGEEESEDDPDGSIISDPPSVPPATPPTPTPFADSYTQTNWTDDGIFKIPPTKPLEDNEKEANIALRTRSKLCLTSTPLEVIEESFIPPDITTDMYDMDCDNDDWMDFLKKFTRPLDEIAKATEDEEHDPEYNILADEEMDKVDKEELRVDKAVKVTRKELNDLIAELFECTEHCNSNEANYAVEMDSSTRNVNNDQNSNNKENNMDDTQEVHRNANSNVDESDSVTVIVGDTATMEEEISSNFTIKKSQIPLLEQQMRQHVQILTQNFLLTYKHPELHHYSITCKEYLLNLKFLSEGKKRSMFYTVNLNQALALVKDWQSNFESDTEEIRKMKLHINKTIAESIQRKQSNLSYIPTFPTLILETISKSEVFLYTFLLPKIPFKSPRLFSRHGLNYTDAEDHLIALGLEQFVHLLKQNRKNLNTKGEVRITLLSEYIQEHMMPHRQTYRIQNHIEHYKQPRCGNNPIRYYYQNKRAPPVVHYVFPLNRLRILPPCKRLPEELPYQWKMFNYPISDALPTTVSQPFALTPSQVYNIPVIIQKVVPKGPVVQQKPVTSTPISCPDGHRKVRSKQQISTTNKHRNKTDPISKFVECLSRPSEIHKLLSLYSNSLDLSVGTTQEKKNVKTGSSNCMENMLPSMPNLGTPIKNCQSKENSCNSNPSTSKTQGDAVPASKITNSSAKGEVRKGAFLEFSTISSTSFQQPDVGTEVEFCNSADSVQTITTNSQNLPSTASKDKTLPNIDNQTQNEPVQEIGETSQEKDNPEDINALMIASSTVKPTVRKEPSGAEKKRAKLKREFLANLSVSTPEDPEVEKQKSEMFALAYYDKMRETLELEDYHKIMQILNDHEEGDAVDLYKKVKDVLTPKYQELADEFLLFLREKEAAAVGQLIPWIRMNNRSKFLRKLEIYFKDQPSQLRKIYKSLTELSQSVGVSMGKIKNTLLPMFKGNAILSDLFLQNFLDERPPPSLLEGPYETIDVSKELSRPDDEEIFETITVPDVEDKYGGPSCICNCHQIEDPEFKSRYRHCIRCGTKFMNGKVYIQTGRGLRPATVSFLTSPNTDHNIRLLGKAPTSATQRKKRSETSPSKRVSLSPTKENIDEESEDDIDGKKKSKKKPPKRKKQTGKAATDSKGPRKRTAAKKNVNGKGDSTKYHDVNPVQKDLKAVGRKRTYSVRKSKVKDSKQADSCEAEEEKVVKPEETPVEDNRSTEECMEWDDNAVANESAAETEIKSGSPDHQTAESESEFCEESSQDNCESDSNSSASSCNNHSQSDSNIGEESSWKREEDKIILETFQKENDKEHAFKIISSQLKNRTVPQISNRFQTLMTLLLETLGTS